MRNNKLIDMMGQRFGILTVVGRAQKKEGQTSAQWQCQCDCGNIIARGGQSLRRGGKETSCGCYTERKERHCRVCNVKLVLHVNYREHRLLYGQNQCDDCESAGRAAWTEANWHRQWLNNLKTRARQNRVPFNLCAADIPVPNRCPVLNIPIHRNTGMGKGPRPNSPTVDRINSAKGYVPGNVRVVSHRVNTFRGKRTNDEVWASLNSKDAAFNRHGKRTEEDRETFRDHRIRVAVWLSYGQPKLGETLPEPQASQPISKEVLKLYRGGISL